MAEVFGLVASVAQLVHLSGTLLSGGYGFLSMVARAPTEIRSLLTEAAAVNSLLGQLQVIADIEINASTEDVLKTLEGLGVFGECRATLTFIETALARCQQEAGKDIKNFKKKLTWPFKEKETKDAMQRLHRLRGVLANAVEVDSAKALRRIETGQVLLIDGMKALTTSIQTQMSYEDTQKVLSWLCPLPTSGAHISLENALSRRLAGTGRWFTESKVFKEWSESSRGSIWITGLAGSGKTLLCASAIQEALAHRSGTRAVLYFFCDHGDPSKVSHDNFVMTLTRQLLEQSPELMHHAKRIYDEKANSGDRPFNRGDFVPLIESLLSEFESVDILCDAVDEALESDAIATTLERLFSYGIQHEQAINVLFTSRFDVQLERRHELITANRVALAENMKPDIEQYVNIEVANRIAKAALKLRDKGLRSTIQTQVAARAGTILHARLQLDYLTTAKNDRDLKNMIQNLPDGLEHTYETLIQHTASRYPERIDEMRTLLRCLVIASPVLTAANLAEILVMQPGQPYLDFDSIATDPYDVLEIIAPFLILSTKRQGHSVVKLSHYSLDEYLLSDRILRSQISYFHVDAAGGNAWLAEMCLQYITMEVFSYSKYEISKIGCPSLEQYSFRQYASLNWYRHYDLAKDVSGFKDRCRPHLKRLFLDAEDGSPCYRRWQEVLRQRYPSDEFPWYSPICLAISHGLHDVVEDLLPTLVDVNVSFSDDYTCLTVAAKWNRPAIIRKLLDLGADLEMPGIKQRTPLHLAAEFASREAFDVLLEAGAKTNACSSSGSTPFYRACRGGDTYIVKRLKDRGCDINAPTHDSWTPIMEAVENGHEDVVDLLLEWGADLTVRTDQGWTVLLVAEAITFAPRKSIIAKLKSAVPKDIYEDFLKDRDRLEDDEDGAQSSDAAHVADQELAHHKRHRDLKPDNILYFLSKKPDGSQGHCKILRRSSGSRDLS